MFIIVSLTVLATSDLKTNSELMLTANRICIYLDCVDDRLRLYLFFMMLNPEVCNILAPNFSCEKILRCLHLELILCRTL